MSDYTIQDVHAANEAWSEVPWAEMIEQVDVPEPVLDRWADMGLITTEGKHHLDNLKETVARADALYDAMPLRKVADHMTVPLKVLHGWSRCGWISTDVSWSGRASGEEASVQTRRVVECYHETEGKTYEDVGEELGIAISTVAYHIKKYRNGDL
jgi:hypothetical protein